MKIKNIKLLVLCFAAMIFAHIGFAQEVDTTVVTTEPVAEDEGKLPVRNPWATGMIIDNQTTESPAAKGFEFSIHHRFGYTVDIADLYGIYASSNIRLGVNYGITDDISIGFGTEKDHKMQEFQGKYRILTQSRDGKMPVSLAYFGNIVIDGREEVVFGTDYKFMHRLSFFNQLIVSRKITDALSVQLAGSYSHFNCVTETTVDTKGDTIPLWKNDYAGVMFGGRYKFYNNMSAIVEYCYPIGINDVWQGQNEPKPNLGLGLEIATSTHAFQVFLAQYRGIIAQQNYARNLNDMSNTAQWSVGFNITIRF